MRDDCVGCYDSVTTPWNNDGTSQLFFQAWQRNRGRGLELPADDPGFPNSRFVHCWEDGFDGCTNVDIQNFHAADVDMEGRGAILRQAGSTAAYVLRGGFWEHFRLQGNIGAFGVPISDEAPWDDLDGRIDEPAHRYPAAQWFQKGAWQGMMVFNPDWWDDPGGIIRYLYPAPVLKPASLSVGTVTMAGFTGGGPGSGGSGGGPSGALALTVQRISYDQVDLSVVNDTGIEELDDLLLVQDGVQVAVLPPGAASTPTISGLLPTTTYTFRLHGAIDAWGPVVFSEPLEVVTLSTPQATLRLAAGVSSVGTSHPAEFLYDECITVTFTIENTGTSQIGLDQVKALAEIQYVDQVVARDFAHANFSPPLLLDPGQQYTYMGDNCDNTFPGFAGRPSVPGVIKPQVKATGVAGLWDISDVAIGARWLMFNLADTHVRPDLIVTDVRIVPDSPTFDQWIALDFDVRNIGVADALNARLEVVLDGTAVFITSSEFNVPAGGTITTGVQPGFLAQGIHHVAYTVDYNNNVWEANENNNGSSFFFTVSPLPDADADGVPDRDDNCDFVANPSQGDADGDTRGDACDLCPNDPLNDPDGDGLCESDNCPFVTNSGQTDTDADGKGDPCDRCPTDALDLDGDGDGICTVSDNCPTNFNPLQEDADADGVGDACDLCPAELGTDADADGICDAQDNCPGVANANQSDGDADSYGDTCDCLPGDAGAWTSPGEVLGVAFADAQTFTWEAPASSGGTAIGYDVIRAAAAAGFNSAVCVETNDSADVQAVDAAIPETGGVFYYLVRARNPCPGSGGTLGTSSTGAERVGTSCPGGPMMGFFDDFNRPDSGLVGNGWTENGDTRGDCLSIAANELRITGDQGGDCGFPFLSRDHGDLTLVPGTTVSLSFKLRLPTVNRTAYAGLYAQPGADLITGIGFDQNPEVLLRCNNVISATVPYAMTAGVDYYVWVDYVANGSMVDLKGYVSTTATKPMTPVVEVPSCAYTPTNRNAILSVDAPMGGTWFFDDVRLEIVN